MTWQAIFFFRNRRGDNFSHEVDNLASFYATIPRYHNSAKESQQSSSKL